MGRKLTGVRVASKTSIEINFRYRGTLCRERLKLKPSPTNLTRADRFRSSVVLAIENGTFDYEVSFPDSTRAKLFNPAATPKTSTESHLDTWLDWQKSHLKASTWKDYQKIIRGHILPSFSNTELADINKIEIRQWCSTLTAGNKRIANILSVFRSALQSALDNGLITANPLDGFSYKRKESIKKASDVDPFTIEEQTRILAALISAQAKNLIQFALWTGLRTSELVALDWADIDVAVGECRVNKAWTQDSAEPEVPKTKSGIRTIKLLPPAIDALRAQKEFTYLKGLEVFQNPLNLRRWTGDQQIRQMWVTIMKKSGVRYRRPYQTRHTYASMMLSAGENPMWVAKQMGHTDWTMIAKVYGKWMPDAQPEAGNKAVAIFGKIANN
ncbi:site-specific integrase [Candidatus Nitrotoga sp. M5]|uniref:site-specific integrase n=1 Tax=Candidatus Nitrotoga sp. M5 TaxID=2890409 RepID=UPI001EF3E737|nr:site-specific integrase [Candidatus Nitrotoga sp. M5]CAH1387067.1 Phage integrase [Candidatus Nitrotoga sp. M5]